MHQYLVGWKVSDIISGSNLFHQNVCTIEKKSLYLDSHLQTRLKK